MPSYSYSYSLFIQNRTRNDRRIAGAFSGVAECVLDLVHPGNLGALPPSPRALLGKAESLGLLSIREYSDMVNVIVEQRSAMF